MSATLEYAIPEAPPVLPMESTVIVNPDRVLERLRRYPERLQPLFLRQRLQRTPRLLLCEACLYGEHHNCGGKCSCIHHELFRESAGN